MRTTNQSFNSGRATLVDLNRKHQDSEGIA